MATAVLQVRVNSDLKKRVDERAIMFWLLLYSLIKHIIKKEKRISDRLYERSFLFPFSRLFFQYLNPLFQITPIRWSQK